MDGGAKDLWDGVFEVRQQLAEVEGHVDARVGPAERLAVEIEHRCYRKLERCKCRYARRGRCSE